MSSSTTEAAEMLPVQLRHPFFRVDGSVAPGYESVAGAFAANFAVGQECNSQCCAYVDGRMVVDLWGTSAEARDQDGYDGDSGQIVFSCTKNVTALVIADAVDRGLITYGTKVSAVWPEFAAAVAGDTEKAELTIADVLRHESGMASFVGRFPSVESMWTENLKRNEVGRVVEAERCRFPPPEEGTRREYHSLTRGFILNEVFRRVDPAGRTVGEFVEEEYRRKLGLGIHIGVDGDQLTRTARLSLWGGAYCLLVSLLPSFVSRRSVLGFWAMLKRAIFYALNPVDFPWPMKGGPYGKQPMYEDAMVLRGEMPSVDGVMSARAMAGLGAYLAGRGQHAGRRIMKESTWRKMHSGPKKAKDFGFDVPGVSPSDFTQGGVNLFCDHEEDPPHERSVRLQREGFYGWQGFGGAVFQWLPGEDMQVSFAYAPTLLAWYDPLAQRGAGLQEQLMRCARAVRAQNGVGANRRSEQ